MEAKARDQAKEELAAMQAKLREELAAMRKNVFEANPETNSVDYFQRDGRLIPDSDGPPVVFGLGQQEEKYGLRMAEGRLFDAAGYDVGPAPGGHPFTIGTDPLDKNVPLDQRAMERAKAGDHWISLPCVEFAPRESSLVQAGSGSLAPLFYECDVCVAEIARISQVPYPEEQAHAPSAVTLKGGSTFFCTLTRQQLRKRLGIFVEEVAS